MAVSGLKLCAPRLGADTGELPAVADTTGTTPSLPRAPGYCFIETCLEEWAHAREPARAPATYFATTGDAGLAEIGGPFTLRACSDLWMITRGLPRW